MQRTNQAIIHDPALELLAESSAELTTLLDSFHACAPVGLGLTDKDGRIVRINESLAAVFGQPVQAHLGRKLSDVVPEFWRALEPLFRQVLATGEPVVNRLMSRPSSVSPGQVRHWLGSYCPVRLKDDIIGVGIVVVDVTDLKDAEQALRHSEARYRAIAETAREGIWTVDLDGRTRYANQRVPDLLGLALEAVYERSAIDILEAQSTLLADRLIHRREHGPEEHDLDYEHPDGIQRVLHISVNSLSGDTGARGSLMMITDITAARRAEAQLHRQALHDTLTGLANRALLRDRLNHAIARQRRVGGDVTVVFLDLDQFKLVNDAHGHAVGDMFLIQVAERLSSAMCEGDTLARFGGDEFVVVAEDTDEVGARAIADRFLATFEEPFDASGHHMYLRASVGLAVSPPTNSDKLLRSADAAMYAAKDRGRGRIRVFDPAQAQHAGDRLALSTDLREALTNDQLALHYQPVVALDTGAIIGVEALLRWNHPTRGAVPPASFVAVAEDTGQARSLDQWVLVRACADLPRIRALLGTKSRLSINISASHLTDTDLEQNILGALKTVEIPANALALELTETALMDDPVRTAEMLAALRSRGLQIAIDDFGTGYSCLGSLTNLPVDTVKIDRCFVDRLTEDPDAFAVTAAIVDLARNLHLSAVAEGVETSEQATLLRRLKCDSAQGFLWSPAVTLDELEALVASRPGPAFAIVGDAPGPAPSPMHRSLVTAEHGLNLIMRMHRDGASLLTIAAALNSDAYQTPDHQRWHRASVARVISDVAYPDLAYASRPGRGAPQPGQGFAPGSSAHDRGRQQ
jgi:diguanylate cyclase (GGDEF)-like protein/PAS domain S-box-containing protein